MLPFTDKFVEACQKSVVCSSTDHVGKELTLRLLKNCHILCMLIWKTLQKSLHVKRIRHTGFLFVPRCRAKKLLVGVEQTCKTADKCRAYLLRME